MVHGGIGPTPQTPTLSDVWLFSPLTQAWTPLPMGPSLCGHTATVMAGVVYLYGGATQCAGAFSLCASPSLGTIYALAPGDVSWHTVSAVGPAPPARTYHAAVAMDSPSGPIMVMHGGVACSQTLSDIWAFDPRGQTWTALAPAASGPAMYAHSAMASALGALPSMAARALPSLAPRSCGRSVRGSRRGPWCLPLQGPRCFFRYALPRTRRSTAWVGPR